MAVVSARNRNFIGVAVLGAATRYDEATIIVVESGGHLQLDGVSIGRGSTLRVQRAARLAIGSRTFVNNGTNITVCEAVDIGADCAISWGVTILDGDGHRLDSEPSQAPVRIEDRVWIGCNATVLKGVTVGAGSIVGAGAVVTRSCPPKSLLIGSPARIAKSGVEWRL
jgi:acetyltransferase-like isoleucine patch superfamily enzyme